MSSRLRLLVTKAWSSMGLNGKVDQGSPRVQTTFRYIQSPGLLLQQVVHLDYSVRGRNNVAAACSNIVPVLSLVALLPRAEAFPANRAMDYGPISLESSRPFKSITSFFVSIQTLSAYLSSICMCLFVCEIIGGFYILRKNVHSRTGKS